MVHNEWTKELSFLKLKKFKQDKENVTSCKIKAKEKTSTLVSYSSFLKTSGATYRPIYFQQNKRQRGNRLRDFLNINQQKWISRSNNGTMQWWTIFLKLDWQEFYIQTSSNNSVTNTAESLSNVSMVLHWKRNVVIPKRKEYSQDVLSHVRGLSSLTLLVTFNSLLTPKSATFRCPVSSLKIFLLCHVKILKH